MRVSHVTLTIALVALAACGKKPEAAKPPAADTAGKMGRMQMGMQGMKMMPLMRAHLDSIGAMPPAQMTAMMAAHQELASRMMDAMGADMRGMGMKPDSAWAALGDSVRQDLAELPGLSGTALKARMQAHIGRMQRMMVMHEGMMRM
jgi:predicted small lipoprotein YifL